MIGPILGESFVQSANLDNNKNGLASIGGANINTNSNLIDTGLKLENSLQLSTLLAKQSFNDMFEAGAGKKVYAVEEPIARDNKGNIIGGGTRYTTDPNAGGTEVIGARSGGLYGDYSQSKANDIEQEERQYRLNQKKIKNVEKEQKTIEMYQKNAKATLGAIKNVANDKANKQMKAFFGENAGNFDDIKRTMDNYFMNTIGGYDLIEAVNSYDNGTSNSAIYTAMKQKGLSDEQISQIMSMARQVYNTDVDRKNTEAGILTREDTMRLANDVKARLGQQGYNNAESTYLAKLGVSLGSKGIENESIALENAHKANRLAHSKLSLDAIALQNQMEEQKRHNRQLEAIGWQRNKILSDANRQSEESEQNPINPKTKQEISFEYSNPKDSNMGKILQQELFGNNKDGIIVTKIINGQKQIFLVKNGDDLIIDEQSKKIIGFKDDAMIYDVTDAINNEKTFNKLRIQEEQIRNQLNNGEYPNKTTRNKLKNDLENIQQKMSKMIGYKSYYDNEKLGIRDNETKGSFQNRVNNDVGPFFGSILTLSSHGSRAIQGIYRGITGSYNSELSDSLQADSKFINPNYVEANTKVLRGNETNNIEQNAQQQQKLLSKQEQSTILKLIQLEEESKVNDKKREEFKQELKNANISEDELKKYKANYDLIQEGINNANKYGKGNYPSNSKEAQVGVGMTLIDKQFSDIFNQKIYDVKNKKDIQFGEVFFPKLVELSRDGKLSNKDKKKLLEEFLSIENYKTDKYSNEEIWKKFQTSLGALNLNDLIEFFQAIIDTNAEVDANFVNNIIEKANKILDNQK